MRVVFTQAADADIISIFIYLQSRNPQAAATIIRRVRDRCFSLAQHPRRGGLVGVRNGRELRRIVELPFVVFYAPTHDRITIFRVLHGARDFQAILDEIFESDPE